MLASRPLLRAHCGFLCAIFVFANVSTTFAQLQISWTYDHNTTGGSGEGSVSGTSAHFSVSYPGFVDIFASGHATGGSYTQRQSFESIPDAVGVYTTPVQFTAT